MLALVVLSLASDSFLTDTYWSIFHLGNHWSFLSVQLCFLQNSSLECCPKNSSCPGCLAPSLWLRQLPDSAWIPFPCSVSLNYSPPKKVGNHSACIICFLSVVLMSLLAWWQYHEKRCFMYTVRFLVVSEMRVYLVLVSSFRLKNVFYNILLR